MDISLNWLKQYADLPKKLDAKEFGLKLTLATVEVEGMTDLASSLNKVVVGKVTKISDHPNADKLKLVDVDTKKDSLKVVCGGSNLSEGMLVAMAKVGAKVRWHGEGELVELKPAKIRGEESLGMICASDEIGLGELFPSKKSGEILDLSDLELKPGQPLATELGLNDIIYEVDNKSLTNRPDLWGHYGMAREAAAIYDVKLNEYKTSKVKEGKEVDLKVEIKDKEACLRYMGVALKNIKVGPSPQWLVQRLQSVGLRSINNIVDVTNFILTDLGQPLHAFDADKLSSDKIIVRKAKDKEKFTTLDDEELELSKQDLVIADKDKAVALAGVMGGLDSGITEETTNIILEAATFDAFTIRRTSTAHSLRTEASARYEKSLDPEMTSTALARAVELFLEVSPGAEVVSKVVDSYPKPAKDIEIKTSFEFLRDRIGQDMSDAVIKKILTSLGFKLKVKSDSLIVTVPSWRATKDVSIQEDLVEEVARMYGYDNLQPEMPSVPISMPVINQERQFERTLKDLLVRSAQSQEAVTYSFIHEDLLDAFDLDKKDHIQLHNPATEGSEAMRQNLLPGLLEVVARNVRDHSDLNLFEVGRVFLPNAGPNTVRAGSEVHLPDQPVFAAGVVTGSGDKEPFYRAKGIVEMILSELDYKYSQLIPKQGPGWAHPKRLWVAELADKVMVKVGEIHPSVLQSLDIKQPVAFWYFNLSELALRWTKHYHYEPLSKFPAIELDLAVVLDDKVLWQDVQYLASQAAPELIQDVSLFDRYKNDKIGVGKTSIAFRVKYQSSDRTLSMDEVQKIQKDIVSQLEKKFKATVRS